MEDACAAASPLSSKGASQNPYISPYTIVVCTFFFHYPYTIRIECLFLKSAAAEVFADQGCPKGAIAQRSAHLMTTTTHGLRLAGLIVIYSSEVGFRG